MSEITPLENIQKIPKKGRGGARVGGGRKLGTTNKLSAQSLLKEIALRDVPFEQGLAEDYIKARMGDDKHLLQRYQQMFLAKVIADKSEVDVTSGGNTLKAVFNFPSTELSDWKQ